MLRIESGLIHGDTQIVTKGLLKQKDKLKRKKNLKKVKSSFPSLFWKEGFGFHFDGVSFSHKTNPLNEARSIDTMAWRKPKKGLTLSSKGKKESNA